MKIIVIGCGVAGATASFVVRQYNADAEISVYTDEAHLYYPRPRLYEVVTGEKKPEEIYSYPKTLYEQKGIKVQLNSEITKIDPAKRQVVVRDGSRATYDKLLLATGSRPSVPRVEGVEKRGVFALRTVQDALAIRDHSSRTQKAIIVGGGLLGLEFAACWTSFRKQAEVVEVNSRLLPKQLDPEGAAVLRQYLEERNILCRLGVKIAEVQGKNVVSGVTLDNGERLSGGMVLIAAGIECNTALSIDAGINVRKGIVVNEYLQTSESDVFAAGDAAEFQGRLYGTIPPSVEQARIAAVNMLGNEKRVYGGSVPFTTLKIAGISLTSIGEVNPGQPGREEIRKTDAERRIYKKLVLREGKIVGAILLGDIRPASFISRIMNDQADITEYKHQILDENFDFRHLLSK
jgi:nitrite reductase (NADH) large subunit